jgi:hypothetical protein
VPQGNTRCGPLSQHVYVCVCITIIDTIILNIHTYTHTTPKYSIHNRCHKAIRFSDLTKHNTKHCLRRTIACPNAYKGCTSMTTPADKDTHVYFQCPQVGVCPMLLCYYVVCPIKPNSNTMLYIVCRMSYVFLTYSHTTYLSLIPYIPSTIYMTPQVGVICQYVIVIELDKRLLFIYIPICMDQIWTFNLVYIYGIR